MRLLYTMNETILRELYAHYASNGRGKGKKPFKSECIMIDDMYKLFLQDVDLEIKQFDILCAFAMSKMSVVEEVKAE